MCLSFTEEQIHAALPKIEKGIKQYIAIRSKLSRPEIFNDTDFRREFNGYYRVRRNKAWQDSYYSLMARAQRDGLQFKEVAELLYKKTKRYEASFASKLVATLNPALPVIDSFVLKNLGLRLPYPYETDRLQKIKALYTVQQSKYQLFLKTEKGRYLINEFDRAYPNSDITETKKLDFILWQTRE